MPLFSRKSKSDNRTPRRRRTADTAGTPERQETLYTRGRTRAGATSHTLRAADERALHAATPREKVHHLTHLRRRLSIVLSVLLVVIICLAFFLQQFTARVTVDFGDAPRVADNATYEQVLQAHLTQNPLDRLRFNMDDERLTAFVTSKLPEVESVAQTGYGGLVTSDFAITLRKPVVSWQVEDKQYFVDAHGVSFTKNVYPAPVVKIVDNSGVEYTSGMAIASERFLRFVGQAVAFANKSDLEVTAVTIPTGTSRQVALTIKDHPYQVIMSIDRSVGEQVEDMVRSLNFFDTLDRHPTYVDLRVKGKAFFRE